METVREAVSLKPIFRVLRLGRKQQICQDLEIDLFHQQKAVLLSNTDDTVPRLIWSHGQPVFMKYDTTRD
jgi:hypothetical protein